MAIGDFMGSGYDFGGASGPGINFGAMPTGVLSPDVAQTFALDPQSWYQASRIAQMGDYASLPQFQRTANYGFEPAYGRYLMSGTTPEFSGYSPTGTLADSWANAIAASSAVGSPDTNLTQQQGQIQSYLSGDDARSNMLAMAAARYGGGHGYAAQSRQRALGNIYDLYSARAAGAGKPAGSFLSYLDTIRS